MLLVPIKTVARNQLHCLVAAWRQDSLSLFCWHFFWRSSAGCCWAASPMEKLKFTLASWDSNRTGEMPQPFLREEAAVGCGLIHVPAEAADLDLLLLVLLIPSCSRSGACVGAVLRPGALPFPCSPMSKQLLSSPMCALCADRGGCGCSPGTPGHRDVAQGRRGGVPAVSPGTCRGGCRSWCVLRICGLLGFLCRPSGAVRAVILHFKSHDSSSIFQT